MEMKMNELRLDFGDDILFNENCFARAFGGAGGTCECRGDAPPPPLLVTSGAIPPFFVFFKNSFLVMSGKIFLAG